MSIFVLPLAVIAFLIAVGLTIWFFWLGVPVERDDERPFNGFDGLRRDD